MSHLLLIEDDRSLGETLKERLEKENHSVTWVDSLEAARAAVAEKSLELVILDVGLPDGSGFELAEELGSTPLIYVTAQTSAEARLKGYETGADEYIPKPFHLKEFLLRVRHVLENHTRHKTVTQDGVTIDFDSMEVRSPAGDVETLPKKDFEILRLLITSAPRVVSRDEILNKVWGEDKFPTNRTVDNTVMRLRQALGQAGGRIRSVRGIGYQWNVKEDENEQ